MNASALDLFVDLIRFAARVAWHGAIFVFRIALILGRVFVAFLSLVADTNPRRRTYHFGQPLEGAAFLSDSDHALGRMGDDYAGRH